MKNLLLFFLLLTAAGASAQEKVRQNNATLKWAPTGLILGNIALQGEYNFGKNSLTAKIGIPVNTHHTFEYDYKDAKFSMKATSFLAGYRTYLNKRHLRGFYFEPYFKYVHHTSEGQGHSTLSTDNVTVNFTNEYNAIGLGAQLGVQFLLRKNIIIDFFFLGPEINDARNTLKAVEISTTLPWTSTQASEARQDILDFVDKFPFIRNRIDVTVDETNKTVTANFKGPLPGYRFGVSFGVAF